MRGLTAPRSGLIRIRLLPAGALIALGAAGCFVDDIFNAPVSGNVACPDIGWPTMVAEVRDQDGQPAAQAATLILTEGDYREESAVPQPLPDPLRLYSASSSRPGRYTVRVTRPWYEPGIIARVTVPSGCRASLPPVVARVTIRLRDDAPPIRSLLVYSPGAYPHNITGPVQLAYQLDANPGIDQSVHWTTSDPSAVTVSPEGVVAPGCGTGYRIADVTATSVADPSLSSSITVFVAASATGSCGGGAG